MDRTIGDTSPLMPRKRVPGLRGGGACIAVAVAVNHPPTSHMGSLTQK